MTSDELAARGAPERVWAYEGPSGNTLAWSFPVDGAASYILATPTALAASPEVVALIREAEARGAKNALRDFDKADWFWRTMDPDDNGDTPHEAVQRAMLGNFCVCEVASSFAGPTRYGFTSPVLDPECDDEEFVHFATHEEAMKAAKERSAALRGEKEPK